MIQHRLRTSCDACTCSKLKCSKEKPACERCQSHNIPCVYSPSQRPRRPKGRSAVQSRYEWERPHFRKPESAAPISPQQSFYDLQQLDSHMSLLDTFTEHDVLGYTKSALPKNDRTSGINSGDLWDMVNGWQYRELNASSGEDLSPNSTGEKAALPLTPSTHAEPEPVLRDSRCPLSTSEGSCCQCAKAMTVELQRVQHIFKTPSAAFDVVLAEVKNGIALCGRVLSCNIEPKLPSDLLLISSVFSALIDSFSFSFRESSIPLFGTENSDAEAFTRSRSDAQSDHVPGGYRSTRLDGGYLHSSIVDLALPKPTLSIGVYQIDRQDMKKLKLGIAAIEMAKLRSLLRTFEGMVQQGAWGGQGVGYLGGLPYALQQQLHGTHEDFIGGLA